MPARDDAAASERATQLRADIDRLIAEGSGQLAAARMRELSRQEPGPAAASFICARFEKLRKQLYLAPHRTAILRSFTVEPLVPLLRAAAFLAGIDLAVQVGEFNTYAQEILDAKSSLYSFSPDSVILAVRTPDIAPDLWFDYTALSQDAVNRVCERASSGFSEWIRTFRRNSAAAFIVHTLEQPSMPSAGILDSQSEFGQTEAIAELNRRLRHACLQHTGVYVLDYDRLIGRHGRLEWQDERKYLLARLPISAENLAALAHEWLRFITPLSGRAAKVLVVDLDNTLWGGIIGEDGLAGIKLGPEYPGAAYQAVQRVMLDLSRRGILLSICSKNNPDDAWEVIDKHPGMLLRRKDFAAVRVNWNDKAQGLREIAEELNVGLDSLAFFDDNPLEQQRIITALPEVKVIGVPQDPLQYAAVLRECAIFERLSLSAEDQQRASMYREQRERSEAEHKFQSKEDFYHFLEQEAEIVPLSAETRPRIAQLTQKTNQFNLTTRRYSEQEIAAIAAAGAQVLSLRVRDRFGDHGIVGVAITQDRGDDCEIDVFLLSCRVIGRTIETALLSYIASAALGRGCQRLLGCFIPTKKNAPAQAFFSEQGFDLACAAGDRSTWVLDLKQHRIACPQWIKLTVPMENTIAAKHS